MKKLPTKTIWDSDGTDGPVLICLPQKRVTEVKAGRFTLNLRSYGNPDMRQYAPISDPETVFVDTLAEASEECRRYIAEWDLGGGNWGEMFVLEGGKKVARISYNGRVWGMDGQEIRIGEVSQLAPEGISL